MNNSSEAKSLNNAQNASLVKFVAKNGDVMRMGDWINNVNAGNFIDYDGFGAYATEDEETNIFVKPSDVKRNKILTQYEFIVWYNR